jgi:hypothetical protein
VGIDGFTLLVEGSWGGTGFSSRIQVLLTTKFFARKLTDGYGINIRKLNRELSEFTYRSRMPLCRIKVSAARADGLLVLMYAS